MKLELTNKHLEHFKTVDPIMYQFLLKTEIPVRSERQDYFISLVRAIVYQQVSGAAGTSIFNKLSAFTEITPDAILSCSDDELRSCGLSYRKASYVKSIADHMLDGSVHFDSIDSMTNQEVIDMLVQIKGIGVWSAQMFMMFSLLREDVDSYGDLAIKRGFQYLYGLDTFPTEDVYLSYVKKWSPYNTYACLALWEASVSLTPDSK